MSESIQIDQKIVQNQNEGLKVTKLTNHEGNRGLPLPLCCPHVWDFLDWDSNYGVEMPKITIEYRLYIYNLLFVLKLKNQNSFSRTASLTSQNQ